MIFWIASFSDVSIQFFFFVDFDWVPIGNINKKNLNPMENKLDNIFFSCLST